MIFVFTKRRVKGFTHDSTEDLQQISGQNFDFIIPVCFSNALVITWVKQECLYPTAVPKRN